MTEHALNCVAECRFERGGVVGIIVSEELFRKPATPLGHGALFNNVAVSLYQMSDEVGHTKEKDGFTY